MQSSVLLQLSLTSHLRELNWAISGLLVTPACDDGQETSHLHSPCISVSAPSSRSLGEDWENPQGDWPIKKKQRRTKLWIYYPPYRDLLTVSNSEIKKTCGTYELNVSARKGGSRRQGHWEIECDGKWVQHGGGWGFLGVNMPAPRESLVLCLPTPSPSLCLSFQGQNKPSLQHLSKDRRKWRALC